MHAYHGSRISVHSLAPQTGSWNGHTPAFKYGDAASGRYDRFARRWSLMGRRTLVAVRRADGRFDCRIAHWGVDADPNAQSRPLGTGWSAETVLDALDAGFEELFVHDGRVRRYCVCWLDPTLSAFEDILLARTDDPEGFRAWWVDRKSRAVEAVAEGVSADAIRDGLVVAVSQRAESVQPPDDASFLRDDR